jgi:hypothetical protein
LQRRWNNPYFRAERRSVTPVELQNARNDDAKDYEEAKRNFMEIVDAVANLPAVTPFTTLNKLRQRIDDLMPALMGIGGPALDLTQKAEALRGLIIRDVRLAIGQDAAGLQRLELAERAHDERCRPFQTPFIAQLLREDSPIPNDEVVASLLSEEPATISLCFETLGEGARERAKEPAMRLIAGAAFDGFSDPLLDEKLKVLGIADAGRRTEP